MVAAMQRMGNGAVPMQAMQRAQQAPMKKSFRSETRKRIQQFGQVTFAANSTVSVELPRVGFINRIWAFLQGTMNLSSGGALADLGPWNLIKNFKVNLNIGALTMFDCQGYDSWLISSLQRVGSRLDLAGIGDTSPDSQLYSAGVANGNNTWNLSWIIPLAVNDGNSFDVGVTNLYSPQIRTTLDITFGQGSDVVTNFNTYTGTLYLFYEFFEGVDPRYVSLPKMVITRWLPDQQIIGSTGQQVYTVQKQGQLIQLLHLLTLNGARSDAYDSVELMLNKSDSIDYRPKVLAKAYQRYQTATKMPTGAILWDMFNSNGMLNDSDLRDALDTRAISTIDSIVTVTAGTTLGSNNNFLRSLRRVVQPVIQRG